MRFQDLSYEDQRLLQTDLGEFDKVAAEQVALIDEMYTTGFNKLAYETADWLDKLAEEEAEKEEEDKMDEEGEKTAAALGAWTERGFFDGLRKLGSDRYGDELHYLYPFLEEKIAAEESWAKKKWNAGMQWGKDYIGNTQDHIVGAFGKDTMFDKRTLGQRAGHAGKAALRIGGPLAVVGGAAYGGKKLYDRRKGKKHEKKAELSWAEIEKIAEEAAANGAEAAKDSFLKRHYNSATKYLKDYGTNTANEFKGMVAEGKTFGQRAGHAGKAALRVGGPLAVVGGTGYGAKKLYDRRKAKKQQQQQEGK